MFWLSIESLVFLITLTLYTVYCPPTDTHKKEKSKRSDPLMAVLYVMIAIVVALVLFVIIVCIFYKCCKKKPKISKTYGNKGKGKGSPPRRPPSPPPTPELEPEQEPEQEPEAEHQPRKVYSSYKDKLEKELRRNQPKVDDQLIKQKKVTKSEDMTDDIKDKKTHKMTQKKNESDEKPKEESEEKPKPKGLSGTQVKGSKISKRVEQLGELLKQEKPNEEKKKEWFEKQNKLQKQKPSQSDSSPQKTKSESTVGTNVAQPVTTAYSNVDAKVEKLLADVSKE